MVKVVGELGKVREEEVEGGGREGKGGGGVGGEGRTGSIFFRGVIALKSTSPWLTREEVEY